MNTTDQDRRALAGVSLDACYAIVRDAPPGPYVALTSNRYLEPPDAQPGDRLHFRHPNDKRCVWWHTETF